jgi:hypothetical protein
LTLHVKLPLSDHLAVSTKTIGETGHTIAFVATTYSLKLPLNLTQDAGGQVFSKKQNQAQSLKIATHPTEWFELKRSVANVKRI